MVGLRPERMIRATGRVRRCPSHLLLPEAIGGRQSVLASRQLGELTRSVSHVRHDFGAINRYESVPDLIRGARRDANAFYYKPDRASKPQDAFSLECEQWRHNDGDEPFVGEIHIPREHDHVDGALECRIQAGNLSTSESKTIPVRIETTRVSAFESARQMVAGLLEKVTQTGQS